MATTSSISICNQALGWLGGNLITSFDDGTTEANLCKANYDGLRQAVLEAASWRFAIKRSIPGRLIDDPPWGYKYSYQLPADHIRTLEVTDSEVVIAEWEQEDSKILCDEKIIYLKYIYDHSSPKYFSASFVQTLAARIAADLAIPLVESKSLQDAMFGLYKAKLDEAEALNGLQGRNQAIISDRLKSIR